MGKTVNKVVLIGYVYGVSKFKYFENGDKVASFVVKTFSYIKSAGGGIESTAELTRCSVWGKDNPSMETDLVEGNLIYVEGSMRTNKYRDKKTRMMTFAMQINCSMVNLMCKQLKNK